MNNYSGYFHNNTQLPRVKCKDDGIHQITLPFAEPNSRFTMLFERLAIDVLSPCNVDGARAILDISWDEAWHIMDKAAISVSSGLFLTQDQRSELTHLIV